MGRPLNSKFFGNRNTGSTTSTDNKIGGEFVSSVTITNAGTYISSLPIPIFSTPAIPSGVTATGIVHGKALSASINAAGVGYSFGNILTAVGGTGTATTFQVTSVQTVGTPTLTAGGTIYDVSAGAKDEIWFDSSVDARWTTPLKIRVETTSGSSVATFSVIQQGVWTGATPPTTVVGTRTYNGPIDNNGNGATFTLSWGVNTVAVASEGDYTAVPNNALATTGGSGTGAQLTVSYGVKNIAITESGSGYINSADAAVSFVPASTTASTTVLTVGSQQNAILAYAYVDGSRTLVDIISQVGSRKYKVLSDSGIYTVKLVGAQAANEGEMDITATDSAGKTYYVKNINSKRALLIQYGPAGHQFDDNTSADWSFGSAVANTSVTVTNVI